MLSNQVQGLSSAKPLLRTCYTTALLLRLSVLDLKRWVERLCAHVHRYDASFSTLCPLRILIG